jgi:hypothetical protein
MEHFKSDLKMVVFCFDNDADVELYSSLMRVYFPRTQSEYESASRILPEDCGNEWGETVIEERVIRVSKLGLYYYYFYYLFFVIIKCLSGKQK